MRTFGTFWISIGSLNRIAESIKGYIKVPCLSAHFIGYFTALAGSLLKEYFQLAGGSHLQEEGFQVSDDFWRSPCRCQSTTGGGVAEGRYLTF